LSGVDHEYEIPKIEYGSLIEMVYAINGSDGLDEVTCTVTAVTPCFKLTLKEDPSVAEFQIGEELTYEVPYDAEKVAPFNGLA